MVEEGYLKKLGYDLQVNTSLSVPVPAFDGLKSGVLAIDIETNESNPPKFVGIALVPFNSHTVFYYTVLESVTNLLQKSWLIGHNIKSDVKWLRGWGIPIKSDQILHDSMILAYSQDVTKESYGLKTLAKENLGWDWPTYKEMVGKGKTKQTLDRQSCQIVAEYCSTDAAASLELVKHYLGQAGGWRKHYYHIELPTYKLLLDMETRGAELDVEYTRKLDSDFSIKARLLHREIVEFVGKIPGKMLKKTGQQYNDFNPNSSKQVHDYLFNKLGIKEKSTGKEILTRYVANHEIIKTLLEYRKISKLQTTYTKSLLSLPTLPRVHASFNQVSYSNGDESSFGIRTTRLSSSNPNLQNIPARSEEGSKIRRSFISKADHTLVCADFSQIEYRLLAHFTKDATLLQAFRNGIDVHEQTARVIFGLEAVTDEQRAMGKTINFAAIYGAGAKKIAATTGKTPEECQEFLDTYFNRLPGVTAWVQRTKTEAHIKRGTSTLLGRFVPLPGLIDRDKAIQWHWERVAVNTPIQGTAAEILKLAMLRLKQLGIEAVITCHDELLFEVKPNVIDLYKDRIRGVMENVMKLDVPLVVDIGAGKNWAEAKA